MHDNNIAYECTLDGLTNLEGGSPSVPPSVCNTARLCVSVSNWLHHSTNCHSLSHVLQCVSGAGEGLSTDSRQLETWQHHSRPGQVGPSHPFRVPHR